MASLQTLRNKGGMIVAIIIGLALVAFLLGDLLTSGTRLFGSGDKAGEIEGTTITAPEYSERVNYLTQINTISTGNQTISKEQQDAINNQAWETFIRQLAFLPSAEKLGLITTNEELQQLFFGANPSQIVQQIFVDPQTGVFDPAFVASFQQNVGQDPTGNMQLFWTYIQNEVADQETVNKYRILTEKSSYITSLLSQTTTSLMENNYNIRFVSQSYLSIPDSTVQISASDVKKYYDEHKSLFKANAYSSINYVLFETLPSTEDRLAADKYITGMVSEFAAAENPLMFAKANSQTQVSDRYFVADELTADMGAFLSAGDKGAMFGPILNGDTYTVARLGETKMIADSMDLSHIVMSLDQLSKADSLFAVLQKGGDFAAAAMANSLDQQSAMMGGKIGEVDPQVLSGEFSTQLDGAKTGDLKLIKTPQTVHIVKVNSVKGIKPRTQLATVNYTVEASETTRNTVYARANSFATAAAGSQSNFNKAVNDSALIARTATFSPNQREVQGLRDSRELVRWAFNEAPKEKVSKVESFGDTFVVASLIENAEKGSQPFDKVKDQIKNLLIIKKKGQILAEKFSKEGSLEAIAAQTGDSVQTANDINFNTFVLPQTGLEPAIAGAVCALNENAVSKPIIGMRAVYSVVVTGKTPNPTSQEVEKQRLMAENQQTSFARAYQAFLDLSRIEDIRYKFF